MSACNHREKKHRSRGVGDNRPESRFIVKCCDEEDNRIHYLLNNNAGLFWNRDVNAAAIIKSILVEYIRFGCDLLSRPTALSRGRQDQGL